jgi:hypothetical protein
MSHKIVARGIQRFIMKIYIQNMVSLRCKIVLKSELDKLGISYGAVELGEADLLQPLSKGNHDRLAVNLRHIGLELMDDKKAILIERIKNVIVAMVHYADELPKVNYSTYISDELQYDYAYLSNIFSKTKGVTIEHYIILHKIEKVKELLLYDELSLSEIAYKMGYSSCAHLSNQFKKVTGLTPTFFKMMRSDRKSLDVL